MKILIIIGISAIILLFMVLSIINSKKKMNRAIIKINEADNNIDLYLQKKKELLKKSKELIKDENYLNDFEDVDFNEIDHFRTNEILDDYNNKFQDEIFENENINKDKEILTLIASIRDNNYYLNGCLKYYNDSVNNYILLKKKFPTKLVKHLCRFKKYDTYVIKKASISLY